MNNSSVSQIRVPVKKCDEVMIRHRDKSFTLAIEWPDKCGDNPNIVISIYDTATMEPPPSHVEIMEIQDSTPPEPVEAFLERTSFEAPMMLSNCYMNGRPTPTNGQLISSHAQINPIAMTNSFIPQNPSMYSSGQSVIMPPNHSNVEQIFCPSHSAPKPQSLGQPGLVNGPSQDSTLTIGQPTICPCPHPNRCHDIAKCSAAASNQGSMLYQHENNHRNLVPSMNRPASTMPLPPMTMFAQQRPTSLCQPTNNGLTHAPLIRANRPGWSSQVMMPRAASDLHSQYFTQTLHSPPVSSSMISQSNCPMFVPKRAPTAEKTNQPVKTPRKRTAKPKTPSVSSIDQPNPDQSLPLHPTAEINDSRGSSSTVTNRTPSIPIRPSIRIVPEEPSPSESPIAESNKTSSPSNTQATPSPTEVSVRSPVSFDSSLVSDETSQDNSEISALRGVDLVVEEVARDANSSATIIPPPKIPVVPADRSQKIIVQKRPIEGRRKPGRPPKLQKFIYPNLITPSHPGNLADRMPYAQSAPTNSQYSLVSNPNVCNNNLEKITHSSITPVQMNDIHNAPPHQHTTHLGDNLHFDNDIPWEENLGENLDDAFPIATPASWSTLYSDIEFLNLHSVNQSAIQDSTYSDHFLHEPAPGSSGSTNNAMCQENQGSLSIMTPPEV